MGTEQSANRSLLGSTRRVPGCCVGGSNGRAVIGGSAQLAYLFCTSSGRLTEWHNQFGVAMRLIAAVLSAVAVAGGVGNSAAAAKPPEYRGSARDLLPAPASVPFRFWWVHEERHGVGLPERMSVRSGWTAFYAQAPIVPYQGPPEGTPFADTIVFVFSSSKAALASVASAARTGRLGHRHRTRYSATLWSAASTLANGQTHAYVTSVFRNVRTTSVGRGELRLGYTAAQSRQDQIKVHRAIHRLVVALTR